jgi:hypothetical protein
LLLLLLMMVISKEQRKECRSYQQEECGDMISNCRHDVNVVEIGNIVLKSRCRRVSGFGAVINRLKNVFAFRAFEDAYSVPERSIHCSTRIFPRVIQLKYTFRPALRSSCAYILVQTTRRNKGKCGKSYT